MGLLRGKTVTGKRKAQDSTAASLEKSKNSMKQNIKKIIESGLFSSIRTKLIAGFLATIIPIVLLGCIFRTHTDTVFENIRTVISELSGH
ncbi:MAG TPA: hypothetical protein GXX26_00130 [Clostridiaceae bacterium]|nr:hypothetical protein [Clostridiaceae bacterium]